MSHGSILHWIATSTGQEYCSVDYLACQHPDSWDPRTPRELVTPPASSRTCLEACKASPVIGQKRKRSQASWMSLPPSKHPNNTALSSTSTDPIKPRQTAPPSTSSGSRKRLYTALSDAPSLPTIARTESGTGSHSPSKRTPSPTRNVLLDLQFSSPAVKIWRNIVDGQPPQHISDLVSSLNFDENGLSDDSELHEDAELWSEESLLDLTYEILACEDKLKDESAWIQIARDILRAANFDTRHSRPGIFEVNSIQTQTVLGELLPRRRGDGTRISKKTDLTIAITPVREEESLLDGAQQMLGYLSQMSDAYTKRRPLVHAVEVKTKQSDADEARVQLAIWNVAGMSHIQRLFGIQAADVKPFFGWTAHGPEWCLHISWMNEEDNMCTLENLATIRVRELIDLKRLLRTMRKIRRWLLEHYWPWWRELLQRKMGGGAPEAGSPLS